MHQPILEDQKEYESWKDYYLEKKKETGGYFQHFDSKKLSVFDSLPSGYLNNTDAFKNVVVACPGGNFLLVPAGGCLVRCIHHCFVFGEPGMSEGIVGISGSRRSSPFTSVNLENAARPFVEPRAMRNSENDGEELWFPSMEEFLSRCSTADEFRDICTMRKLGLKNIGDTILCANVLF
jgi:hypothetical protein